MAIIDLIGGGQLSGNSSTGSAFTTLIDNSGNIISKKNREKINSNQEALIVAGKNDDWSTILRTDRKGNLLTGNYIPELFETFEGTNINAQKWITSNTTFVPAQSAVNGYVFNNSSLTTANAVAILQSQRFFYKIPRVPLQNKTRLRANCFTNSTIDFGWGIPTTTTLLTPNGVSVRVINGLWVAAITSNGSELIATNINDYLTNSIQLNTANTNSEYYVVDLIIDDDNAVITVQNTQTGTMVGYATLPVPFSASKMFISTALPFYYRVFNSSSAPSTAPNLTLSEIQILSTDWGINLDGSQVAGLLSMSSGRNPFSGLQLENHTNSTAPTSATLSNTAAGYTTLGGKFQFAAPAGAVTDFALFGFQVPNGARFLCEGIRIDTYNTVVAVATTATVFEWSMGFNSSAVSLATANIIRKQVGVQSLPIGAAVGALATPIDVNFVTPEIVESGRFLHVILNVPIGTATATEIFRGVVTIKGRFI